jgi:hypothetical protein
MALNSRKVCSDAQAPVSPQQVLKIHGERYGRAAPKRRMIIPIDGIQPQSKKMRPADCDRFQNSVAEHLSMMKRVTFIANHKNAGGSDLSADFSRPRHSPFH